jgi:Leucine-rich repeat (LRR) protein
MLLLRLSAVGLAVYLGAISVVQATTDCGAVTQISQIECESLLQLYQSTNGANWKRNKGWNVSNTPCDWVGVTCNKVGVIQLQLSYNNITGTLPNFSGLPELQRLRLDDNQLTGAIPDFSGLPKLQTLVLSRNKLTGAIPDFSGLPKLQTLSLSHNKLTGTIPDFSGLPKLQTLELYFNQLTGAIPDFSGLPKLENLNLYGNKLTGAIPDFSGLPKLENLNLYGNKLTGAIPDFSGLPELQTLFLYHNKLTSAIPDFSGLPKLQALYLHENQLTGAIPDFSGLPKLQALYLGSNQLTGAIPDFSGLPKLQRLRLEDNQVCKHPKTNYSQWQAQLRGFAICRPPTAAAFTVSSSSGKAPLTDQLEASGSADGVHEWRANGQTFVGQQTSATFTAPSQYTLSLTVTDNHELTATTRQTVTATTNCQQVTGVSERECESLLQLYQSTNGTNWKQNKGWNVTNTPCEWVGVTCDKAGVIELKLSQNNLTGTLPNFSGLPELQTLVLNNNQLTGAIPDFSGLPQLQTLVLNNNQLTGAIPDFRGLSKLQALVLSDNQVCKHPKTNYSQWQAQLKGFAICKPPTAAFTVSSLSGKAPLTVQLDASGSSDSEGAIVQYEWTANGQTFVGQQTSATFTAPGQYTLVLTVTDNHGLTATTRQTVTATTNCQQVTGVSERECESLLQLYQSTNGTNWKQNKGWNVTNTPCDWVGVICDKADVIHLVLSQNNLTGTLPNFSGLPELQTLVLNNNQLTGAIPDFSGLPKLQALWLNENQLTGAIPDFSGLPKLQKLYLYRNKLTGAIPDFSGLPKLQALFLLGNQLTGAIPDFSGLPKLQELFLDSNQLTGVIPDFSGLSELHRLRLDSNQLTGAIPDFSGLPELQALYLLENQLTGAIPDFSNLTNLEYLDLSNNPLCQNPNINYGAWRKEVSKFPFCQVNQ